MGGLKFCFGNRCNIISEFCCNAGVLFVCLICTIVFEVLLAPCITHTGVSGFFVHFFLILFLVCSMAGFIFSGLREPGTLPQHKTSESAALYLSHVANSLPGSDEVTEEIKMQRATKFYFMNGVLFKSELCPTCKVHKAPGVSHCSACNRCTVCFDHHCSWVGQDVSARNYAPFLFATLFMSLFGLDITICCIVFCVAYLSNSYEGIVKGTWMEGSRKDGLGIGQMASAIFVALFGVTLAFFFPMGIFISHVTYIRHDTTTRAEIRQRAAPRANAAVVENIDDMTATNSDLNANNAITSGKEGNASIETIELPMEEEGINSNENVTSKVNDVYRKVTQSLSTLSAVNVAEGCMKSATDNNDERQTTNEEDIENPESQGLFLGINKLNNNVFAVDNLQNEALSEANCASDMSLLPASENMFEDQITADSTIEERIEAEVRSRIPERIKKIKHPGWRRTFSGFYMPPLMNYPIQKAVELSWLWSLELWSNDKILKYKVVDDNVETSAEQAAPDTEQKKVTVSQLVHSSPSPATSSISQKIDVVEKVAKKEED